MDETRSKGKFTVNGAGFGSYAYIKTGPSEEVHIYKVVRIIESNSYCEIPIQWNSEPKRHDGIVPVAEVIHCGIDESKVVRVAISDCERIDDSDCKVYKEISEKLKEYEDLEEHGLLLRLPCNVGDTIYVIGDCEHISPVLDGTMYGEDGGPGSATGYYCPYELNEKCPYDVFECDEAKELSAVFEDEVSEICVKEDGIYVIPATVPVYGKIGEFIFLSKDEAEAAFEKMKEAEE